MKYIILIIITILSISCDRIIELELNENKSYNLTTSCGNIVFMASLFTTNNVFIKQKFKGKKFAINSDSLKIQFLPPNSNEVSYTSFANKKGKIYDNYFFIEYEEEFELAIKLKTGLKPSESIIILPCNYITCNGKTLITDTIRIKFAY